MSQAESPKTVAELVAAWRESAKNAMGCAEDVQLGLADELEALPPDPRVAELARLAFDLLEHLDYCGWGDSWERECSEPLRERAEQQRPLLERLAKGTTP